eukprot:1711618-Amphidinium_carterae.1
MLGLMVQEEGRLEEIRGLDRENTSHHQDQTKHKNNNKFQELRGGHCQKRTKPLTIRLRPMTSKQEEFLPWLGLLRGSACEARNAVSHFCVASGV